MSPINPTVPNLADYRSFVYGLVLGSNGSAAYPFYSSTVSAGTVSTLTDLNAKWIANQWIGCVVFDVTQSWGGVVVSNTDTVLSFIVSAGSVQLIDNTGAYVTNSSGGEITATGNTSAYTPKPGDQYIVVQSALSESLAIALELVNDDINSASPTMYTKAVYNLAADRLINFGVDIEGQTILADYRTKFELLQINSGTVASASDQGTSGSLVVPEQMKSFTVDDLQLAKTPFGRNYLGIAQAYGPTLWGLS